MGDPMARLEEARKQIVIASDLIGDDDHLEVLEEARRLIDEIRDERVERASQRDREQA